MNNGSQPAVLIDIVNTSGAALASGDVLQITNRIAVAAAAIAAGATGTGATEGAFTLPKTTGQAITQGQDLYWDNATKKITTTVGTNAKAGYAVAAKLAADTTVVVKINA